MGKDGPLSVSCVRRGDALLLSIPRSDKPRAVMPSAALAELRTTTYNLHMAAELMANRSGGDEKLSTYAAILQHNYFSLLRLTRNIADANDLSRGELRIDRSTLSLRGLYSPLVDSVNFFTRDRGVTIHFSSSGSCLVQGDQSRLEQLLLNLLANALLHTERGGEIHVSLRQQGEQVVLAVDDNGHGMDERALAALFTVREEPDAVTGGAGLGLYVCRGIIRAHGGSILVESRPDKGTKIRVMFPLSRNLPLRDGDNTPYGTGMILTELAPVLCHESYDKRYRD